MVKASRGNRQRSRSRFSKPIREKGGVPPLGSIMIDYTDGQYVVIDVNSAIHYGMPHRRFQGRVGKVVGKRGKSYIVAVSDKNASRILLVRPEHLKPFKGATNAS